MFPEIVNSEKERIDEINNIKESFIKTGECPIDLHR